MSPDSASMPAVREPPHTALADHFADLSQQQEAGALGMWIFLATEVLFFGTLFLGLNIFRHFYPEAFEAASTRLNWVIGGSNTLVLLVSSLTIALALHALKHGQQRQVLMFLATTLILGLAFLGLKALEYKIDFDENLVPGFRFEEDEWIVAGLSAGQVPHVKLFLFLYWVMTAFHALHMIIGIGAVAVMFLLAWRGRFSPAYYGPVEVTALYWHFVDIVWIFLLPNLYLLGTHA